MGADSQYFDTKYGPDAFDERTISGFGSKSFKKAIEEIGLSYDEIPVAAKSDEIGSWLVNENHEADGPKSTHSDMRVFWLVWLDLRKNKFVVDYYDEGVGTWYSDNRWLV